MDKWQKFRQQKLDEYAQCIQKNEIDEPIKKLIAAINKNRNLVTTSSCSGMIVLLEFDLNKGKKTAKIYKKWHRKIDHEELEIAVSRYAGRTPLWFRLEPFVIYVAAKDIATARKFLKNIRDCDAKHAGIQTITPDGAFIEARGEEQMTIPVGCIEGEWHKIAMLSNEMLDRNFDVLKKLEKIKW